MDTRIYDIKARQILDSRGNPTIETTVILKNGAAGTASVPSGASTGSFEAHELRDGEKDFNGKGVTAAVKNAEGPVLKALKGVCADKQRTVDRIMTELDGTNNKSALGANTILSVSLACAKASAFSYKMPLFRYIGGTSAHIMPKPMMNILNGGKHAPNKLDIQEFMIVPTSAKTFSDSVRIGAEVYASLGKILKQNGYDTAIGDEGGFAPQADSAEEALELICEAVKNAGYQPKKDICIALDIAAGEWFNGSEYKLPKAAVKMTRIQLLEYYMKLVSEYPIISIEDPFGEDDYIGFSEITKRLRNIQIVGDDLFVTNPDRIRKGIECGCATAVLIKPNQIGTLSETIDAVITAKSGGLKTILSHRSGDTEDTAVADIAVGLNSGQIKIGAPARGERTCKYNRLIRIEQMLR
ncbi:MAG: phosphopyruvate hydratase [Ruminococcaceae bacterium]|nr:phosphopyruvate hydratase [Oscillospiraceae bacterium]